MNQKTKTDIEPITKGETATTDNKRLEKESEEQTRRMVSTEKEKKR